jgi:hypothetical protein
MGLLKKNHSDGRPEASRRLEAEDAGPVLRHGDGPGRCDELGARDVWVCRHRGRIHLYYDGAGPRGWLACLATSNDLRRWTKSGAVLGLGRKGSRDSGSASYLTTYPDRGRWHGFYVGTPNTSGSPEFIPAFPYLTMKATADSPSGPWRKDYRTVPFMPRPGTYYAATASPGCIVRHRGEHLMYFSASVLRKSSSPGKTPDTVLRTLGIARTRDLDGAWTPDPEPIVPLEEQIENATMHYEPANRTWFLFTNHVALHPDRGEYTDAVWVYWSRDPNRWDPADKAVVLDSRNCRWSPTIIGLPSVVKVGNRLALFYDGRQGRSFPGGVESHMRRDIGLAWLDLPLRSPSAR